MPGVSRLLQIERFDVAGERRKSTFFPEKENTYKAWESSASPSSFSFFFKVVYANNHIACTYGLMQRWHILSGKKGSSSKCPDARENILKTRLSADAKSH